MIVMIITMERYNLNIEKNRERGKKMQLDDDMNDKYVYTLRDLYIRQYYISLRVFAAT